MKSTHRLETLSKAEWTEACHAYDDYAFMQNWEFCEAIAGRYGATNEFIRILDDQGPVGLACVRVKRLPLLGGVAYVSGGPMTRKDGDSGYFGLCLAALEQVYGHRRGLIVRCRAPLGDELWNKSARDAFDEHSFVDAPGPIYRSVLVDLRRPLSEIRSGCSRRWRRGLKQSEKVELKIVHGQSMDLFQEFLRLYQQMRRQKSFDAELDAQFYFDLQPKLDLRDQFEVRLAFHDGQAVAGVVNSLLGAQCTYVLGASNAAGRDTRAAYRLHFSSIEHAAAKGLRWYDAGGIDPDEDPGVSTFKLGLGGLDVTAAGPKQSQGKRWRERLVLEAERRLRQWRRRRSAALRGGA